MKGFGRTDDREDVEWGSQNIRAPGKVSLGREECRRVYYTSGVVKVYYTGI